MSSKSAAFKTLIWVYKVLRSILFSAILMAVGLFAFIYVALSIPPIQKMIKERAQNELSIFLGSEVEIRNLTIHPLNEIILEDAVIHDLQNEECLNISRLGASINLWRLLFSGEIEITYVELIDFKANIYQKEENQPLNIDFIIKAFEPKDKNKPPTRFDLKIHNIVVRGGEVKFSKLWKKKKERNEGIDFNYLSLSDLCADITIPRLSNEDNKIDLRRLSFNEKSGLQVKEISGFFNIFPDSVSVKNLTVRLPESEIKTSDFTIPKSIFTDIQKHFEPIELSLINTKINPSNLAAFYTPLADIDIVIPIKLKVSANSDHVFVENLEINANESFDFKGKGLITNLSNLKEIGINIEQLDLTAQPSSTDLIFSLVPDMANKEKIKNIANALGNLNLSLNGKYEGKDKELIMQSLLQTEIGELNIDLNAAFEESGIESVVGIEIASLDFQRLFPENPVNSISDGKINFAGFIDTKKIDNTVGTLDFTIGNIDILNRSISSINGSALKHDNEYDLSIEIDDINLNGHLNLSFILDGVASQWNLDAVVNDFDSYNAILADNYENGFELRGNISGHASGNNPDNILGELNLSDFHFVKSNHKQIYLKDLTLQLSQTQDSIKQLRLQSEIADLNVSGKFIPSRIPAMIKRSLWEIAPSVFKYFDGDTNCGEGNFELAVKDAKQIIDFFDLPIFPLTEINFTGSFNSETNHISLLTDIPYIQQGSNKLITSTYLNVDITGKEGRASLLAGTVYPTKKGLLKMDLDLNGKNGEYDLAIDFNRDRDVKFYGDIRMRLTLNKEEISNQINLSAEFLPSQLSINNAIWEVGEARVDFNNELLSIDNFSIRHSDQFITISGINTKSGEGEIWLNLADINLDYLFETLNIPHVTFGGLATGEILAKEIFSPDPKLLTQQLLIKDMSYNGAVVGDGNIKAKFSLPEKKIGIGAVISENDKDVALVDGGVWIGRDSLAFNFKADGVNIGFMQPFMSAFSSDVKGKASGDALLYGTFSDIDMIGTIKAENAQILIDYINARYSGSDTVYLHPGRIEIPNFTVVDKKGNTAVVEGILTHKYFHDPEFKFQIKDMDHLLVYDTNAKNNPLWYGTLYASGFGEISGKPGSVNIVADVQTESGSDFTFVLSDQQEALKSHFLTFSDKRKAAIEAAQPKDTIPDFLQKFYSVQQITESSPDIFTMDFRVSVTDDVKFNLIMDPVAGDKITAYGSGAMSMSYTSLTDELKLFGKYTLDKGTYNFSLQDIILKDFVIKPGSSISFTGNPYTGMLNITAAYKVNTSLTELDKSFANDRDLNRTSVPVEALLKVSGVLTSPNIDFDIELPTVTEETAQKVRSIISTEDMMSRQVLYLVALNKFYSPEYMSTSNSGGEWASIASSTISSQLQNMIGQITDKFTLAPSIRSDKGDFSDIEVDIALSSQLFNNRLLINGNLGYRDPNNSSTTFIGDFDLEYLLNRKGTWRLKAYNHFNDQNYYLKSALTTQGIGIVWRKEFGLPRKKEESPSGEGSEKQ